MADRATDRLRTRRRHTRLLYSLEAHLEIPMFLLALAWLWLFVDELIYGLSAREQTVVTVIWALFIAEFALKLYLAPKKLAYVVHNWITVVALVLPAFRAFRIVRALRVLRATRVASTTRVVRALTSSRRFYRALHQAQGPAPEPEMNVGVMIAASAGADTEELQRFAQALAADVRTELRSGAELRWTFHDTEPVQLASDSPRTPAEFVDDASLRMAEGPYDLVIVVTDVALVSRRRRVVAGLVSTTSRIAVVSVRKLLTAPRGTPMRSLQDAKVRANAGALLLHLIGRICGLHPASPPRSRVMAPFEFRESRRALPSFTASERATLAAAAARLPERELRGGNALTGLVFHILMASRHPWEILRPLLRNKAPLLPLALPGLSTAAVAPAFLLVFTAEIWDVGLGMSDATAALYATVSILAASFYLVRAQSLFLPRKEKRVLTEHLAVANTVIFLSILLACIGLFLMVGLLMILIELYIFPSGLMQTWPTLAQPDVTLADKLRLAVFISTVGVTTGALAGGFESRTVLQHLALFEDEG